MPSVGQQLVLLFMVCMALQTTQAWLLPKLDEEKIEKELKKLDFLNIFKDKLEEKKAAKLEKIVSEFEKLKEWLEEKKLKELSIFEEKKEIKEEAIKDKIYKKKDKKPKKPKKKLPASCYESYEVTPSSYVYESAEETYASEELPLEEEIYASAELYKPKAPKPCKKCNSYDKTPLYLPTAYDVREDYAAGVRYFT